MNLRSLIPIGRDRTMAAREANPFTTLQREVDRLFDDFARGFGTFPTWPTLATGRMAELMPSMDVTETDKEIEITAELPRPRREERADQTRRQRPDHQG